MPTMTAAEALAELEQELDRRRRSREIFAELYRRAGLSLDLLARREAVLVVAAEALRLACAPPSPRPQRQARAELHR